MIFATVGTTWLPFDRLLHGLDRLPGDEELVVQRGASAVHPARAATCVEFLPFEEILAGMRRARVVVTHAGAGSILAALAVGKRPVVVPRTRSRGEAVDDHQVELGRRLGDAGLVTVVEDVERLPEAVLETPEHARDAVAGRGRLARDLRDQLTSIVGPAPAGAATPTRKAQQT